MRSSLPKLTILVVVATTILGCGKQEYEAQMLSSVKDLAFGSRFIDNLHIDTTEAVKGVAELRLPLYVGRDVKTLTSVSKDRYRKPMSPDRIQPPSMRIPGFRYKYEMFVGDGKDKETLCWYFGAVPATEKLATIEATIKSGAAKTAPKSRPAFVDASLDTPERTKIAFRKMSVTGTQTFQADPETIDTVKRPGQLDVYIHSNDSHHVIFVIRGTQGAIEEVDAMDHASYALGTLKMLGSANDSGDDA